LTVYENSGTFKSCQRHDFMRKILAVSLFLIAARSAYTLEKPDGGMNVLKLFLVSETPIIGGRFIDTPECRKVGYISNVPSLVITSLQSVATNTSQHLEPINGQITQISEPSIMIRFNDADAKSFGELTRNNVGHRLLLTLADRPLIAPTVNMPIESGSVAITFGGRTNDITNLLAILESLVRPK
jgi:hypothetical protein